MSARIIAFLRNDSGYGVAEYGLVAAFIFITVAGGFNLFLSESGTQLTTTQTHLSSTAMNRPTPTPTTAPVPN